MLHDVSSGSALVSFVRTALAYRDLLEVVIISRATGGAAQYGIADASKALYRESVAMLVVQDIPDVLELFPGRNLIFFSRRHGEPFTTLRDLGELGGSLLCFSGSETGFARNEIPEGARAVYPSGAQREMTPDAYLSIVMHLLVNEVQSTRSAGG